MNKWAICLSVGLMIFSTSACSQRAENSSDAIEQAKAKGNVEQQEQYLVSQAQKFISSEQYEEAQKVAQHVLKDINSESQAAKKVIMDTAEEIKKQAAEQVEALKGQANEALDNVKGAIGNIGQ